MITSCSDNRQHPSQESEHQRFREALWKPLLHYKKISKLVIERLAKDRIGWRTLEQDAKTHETLNSSAILKAEWPFVQLRLRVTALTRFIKEHLLWTQWKIASVKILPALLTYIFFIRKASLITEFIRNFRNSFLHINFCIWIQHRQMQQELWKNIIILSQGYICQWV